MRRFWRWLRSGYTFLVRERCGYRRPSQMTPEELAFRERALVRLDELERYVRVMDAKARVWRIGRE